MRNSILIGISLMFILSNLSAQTIYEWRNGRTGIYNEGNLLDAWKENQPQLIWDFVSVGNGYGSPTFVGDRFYIQGEIDGEGFLYAISINGDEIWKSSYGEEWIKSFPGSRAAPTVVDDLIYVSSGKGNIICFTTNGKLKWKKELIKDFHGQTTMHGHSESIVVDGDNAFFVPGGKDTNVVALNRFTGDIKWICKGLGERPAYNAPLLINLDSRKLLVTFSAYTLMGIDAESGELLWKHLQDNVPVEKRRHGMGDTHSNTVIYENGFIYYVAGDGNCGVKLELSKDGTNIKEVWRNKDVDGYMGGIISSKDYLYCDATRKKQLLCVNKKTGKIEASIKIGSGSVISADEKLYYYSQKGKLHLINPDPRDFKSISSFRIKKGSKEHFAHPVIHQGVLYVRHGYALMAYDISTK